MGCCSQTIFLLWPKIAAVGEILWSPSLQPNDDNDDDHLFVILGGKLVGVGGVGPKRNILTVIIAPLPLWCCYWMKRHSDQMSITLLF